MSELNSNQEKETSSLHSLQKFVAEFPGNDNPEFGKRETYWVERMMEITEAVERGEMTPEQAEYLRAGLVAIPESQANHDSLTELYNRREMPNKFREMYARVKRSGEQMSLLFIDLDGLKEINDTYGHEEGSEALKSVAEGIKETIRGDDVAIRWGGDEFVVMCLGLHTDDKNSKDIAQRILEAVRTKSVSGKQLTVSIGVAKVDLSSVKSLEEYVKEVDGAMYRAKSAGKNQVSEVK